MEFDENPMALIPHQTHVHETNFNQNQTKIHQINPTDVDQNRNPKRNREEDEDDEEEDSLCLSDRQPAATQVPCSYSDPRYKGLERHKGLDFYKDYKAACGECVQKHRQCPASLHAVPWFSFGVPMLEVYKIKIVIEKHEMAKELYRVEYSNFSSSSRLYGAIKVCKLWEEGGEFLYKVERDNAESINLFRNHGEITLPHLKHPFYLLSDTAIIVALKLNGVDLLKKFNGCDNYGPYCIEEFGDENIASGRIYFDSEPTYWLRRSYVETRSVWGSRVFGEEEELDCPNPISVYVEYGVLHLAVEAQVLSVAVLDDSVTHVSGHIFARSCILDPDVKSVLFRAEDKVALNSHKIALQKPCVAVPSKSYLLIEAKLHNQQGKLIVHGTFPFIPLPTGTFVSAANGIEIRLEWHEKPNRY